MLTFVLEIRVKMNNYHNNIPSINFSRQVFSFQNIRLRNRYDYNQIKYGT